eukprot:8444549-Pyramimonas_sp.AAC.1
MITDNSALVTVAEQQRGRLPAWGHPRDSDISETHVKGSPTRTTTYDISLRPCDHHASICSRCRKTSCGRLGGHPPREGRHSGESSH